MSRTAPRAPAAHTAPDATARAAAAMGRLAALALAAAAAAAAAAVAAASAPTPTPKAVKVRTPDGRDCIHRWFVTAARDAGGWVWADETRCCPPRMPTKSMTVFRRGSRCTETWTQCDTALNGDGNCVRRWCDSTACEAPVCPPKPPVMKTRYVRRGGERCVKTWSACGTRLSGGVCSWEGCDALDCKAPCAKPAPKTMRTQTRGRVCVEHWWPTVLSVDKSTDAMRCTWAWKDAKTCWCADGASPTWKQC